MYPVDTPQQLRTILRALRHSRQLTQVELGARLGVSQKRVARIEAAPELTSFDQIARMVSAMGARLIVEEQPQHRVAEPPAPYGNDTW
ncbi:MAG: helix-turn-helix transcriptional regulator [Pseudomonadota bacterium]